MMSNRMRRIHMNLFGYMSKDLIVWVPLKETNFEFFYDVSALFTGTFDVWYDNSSSFY